MSADSKVIYTEDGTAVDWFERTPDTFVSRTTLIFGGTHSGKTTIMEEILHECRHEIPNYLVICPNTSSHAYRKKLPDACIKSDLSKETLIKIWNRQHNLTQCCEWANDISTLKSLFNRCKNMQTYAQQVNAIKSKASYIIDLIKKSTKLNFSQQKAQITIVEMACNKRVIGLYKNAIRKNKKILLAQRISAREKTALLYLDTNPRLVLIMDDCSEKFTKWLKYFSKNEENIFEAIFFRGRHNNITFIFAAHDDKIFPTELRKNATNTIFTTSNALMASIGKAGSGYTSQEKKDAQKLSNIIFHSQPDGAPTYQKICYVREDSRPFKYFAAEPLPDYKLGFDSLWNLSKKIPQKNEDQFNKNPYLQHIVKDKNANVSKKVRSIKFTRGRARRL